MGSTAGKNSTFAINEAASGDSLDLAIKSARLPPLFALLRRQLLRVRHVQQIGKGRTVAVRRFLPVFGDEASRLR